MQAQFIVNAIHISSIGALRMAYAGLLMAADYPQWRHLSSAAGDLPIPNGGREQTACLALDIDKDGPNDIVIAERSQPPSIVWLKRQADGWIPFPVETGKTPVAAGGAACDMEGDGNGNFTKTERASGIEFHEAKVADLNGDGRLDIVSKPFVLGSPRVDVWLNLGTKP